MFFETLPQQCPPADAIAAGDALVFRAVRANPPTIEDFHSQAMLGTIELDGRPEEFVCRASSCSVFTTLNGARKLKKLPKLRDRVFVASVQLTDDAGVIRPSAGAHMEWWIYRDFDVLSSVVEVCDA